MRCEEAEESILEAGGVLSETVQRHVDACPECRAFRATHARMLAREAGPVPSKVLDQAVLAHASVARRRRQRAGFSGFHPVRKIRAFPVLRVAAAAAVMAGASLFWLRMGREAIRQPEMAAVVQGPRDVGWDETELAWTVLDAEMETALSELSGGSAGSMSGSGAAATPPAESGSGLEGMDQRLRELELELYIEQELLPGNGAT